MNNESTNVVVAALAGRRIDLPASKDFRFPIENIARVRRDLKRLFAKEDVGMLVCSAACGADLIALDIARKRGIRARIILPFSPERFRQSSVVDRPGDWGTLFDEVIESTPASDVIVLQSESQPDDAYEAVTQEIILQAAMAASPVAAIAIAVWEGNARQETDATASFLRHAKQAGMVERIIRTC